MVTKRSFHRFAAMFALALGAAALVAAAIATFTYPAAAAIACPGCYGFERLAPTVFVERTMPATKRAEITAVIAEARTRVAGFYVEPGSSPRILVCEAANG